MVIIEESATERLYHAHHLFQWVLTSCSRDTVPAAGLSARQQRAHLYDSSSLFPSKLFGFANLVRTIEVNNVRVVSDVSKFRNFERSNSKGTTKGTKRLSRIQFLLLLFCPRPISGFHRSSKCVRNQRGYGADPYHELTSACSAVTCSHGRNYLTNAT